MTEVFTEQFPVISAVNRSAPDKAIKVKIPHKGKQQGPLVSYGLETE